MKTVRYISVNRSDEPHTNAEAGYSSICMGLFQNVDEALRMARGAVQEGYHVSLEWGEMSEEDWEALEEVPDDFQASQAAAENEEHPR